MDTYEVKVKSPRVNLKYRFIAVLCFAALLFLIRFGWSILSHPKRGEAPSAACSDRNRSLEPVHRTCSGLFLVNSAPKLQAARR